MVFYGFLKERVLLIKNVSMEKETKLKVEMEQKDRTTSKGTTCQTVPIKVPLSLVGLLIQYAKVY